MTEAPTPASIRADHPEPLWIQAVNLIKDQLGTGALKPGSRLPPERELCERLGISRVTLRKALSTLVEEGILSASHGRGWYVAPSATAREWPNSLESFTETARRMGLAPSSTVLRQEVVPANLDEAEQLSIAPGTPLFVLERVRLLNGVPTALDLTQIPAELVPGFADLDFRAGSLYEHIAAAGLDLAKANATIEAREADADLAARLQLEEGKPVLVMRQLVLSSVDRPLFSSMVSYRGDRYRLRTFFLRMGGMGGSVPPSRGLR
ncbi:transcriptional regulator [Acrocarpospora phusangensis]|uniref:Transcriptional regulator n=1 Tax=Acrocarpospora phusangensis TaxID=1070424 RepID=A0A919QHZ9_9ACTN|nr:GntR family transcriptional regulator [Acrocarpospora phusangensis]GIH26562.1 transcriptional regulator [Acrocarpospora phusangensis]